MALRMAAGTSDGNQGYYYITHHQERYSES
jgi:hypothetical protein